MQSKQNHLITMIEDSADNKTELIFVGDLTTTTAASNLPSTSSPSSPTSTTTITNSLRSSFATTKINKNIPQQQQPQRIGSKNFQSNNLLSSSYSYRLPKKKNKKVKNHSSVQASDYGKIKKNSSLNFSQFNQTDNRAENQFLKDNLLLQNEMNTNENHSFNESISFTKRTVIIHKDSRGYGMRISGDNPVYIQHVNEEGAAYKAGVRAEDRIIKVNGTLVTRLGHAEVVRMIQSCGSFVGLTLLSRNQNIMSTVNTVSAGPTSTIESQRFTTSSPSISPTPSSANLLNPMTNSNSTSNLNFNPIYPMHAVASNNSVRITGPQPVPESTQQRYHENQIRTLQEMISNEWRHLEEKKLMRAPQQELDRCQKRINEMRSKLEVHQSTIGSSNQSHSRQQSFENDQQTFLDSKQSSDNGNSNASSLNALGIMTMDDDVDQETDNCTQPYEYIEDSDLSNLDITSVMSRNSANSSAIKSSSTTMKEKIRRDSKLFALSTPTSQVPVLPTKAWFNLHLDSLRLCRYLIQQKSVSPNELLFYVLTRTVFPKIVTSLSLNNKAHIIQRWAYQIIATFIIKESPLFMLEFSQEHLEKFDRNLNGLISANPAVTDIIASPFEPFWKSIHEIVRKQWEEFMTITQRQRPSSSANSSSSWLQTSPKNDLQTIIELLLTNHFNIGTPSNSSGGSTSIQAKVDLRDIDSILDGFVQHVKSNQSEATMLALISSLLAIGHYIFDITTSKHCLLLEFGNGPSLSSTLSNNPLSVSASLNPVLKLSSEASNTKKAGSKRNSMIPIGSKPFSVASGALGSSLDSSPSLLSSISASKTSQTTAGIIEERSHYFVPVAEMNHIIFCTSCMLPLWGDPYTLKCTKCLMHSHLWCRKVAAANNICNDVQCVQSSFQSSQSGKSSYPNRRVKSEKKSVFEKITGKKVSKRSETFNLFSGPSLRTSSCSSSTSSSDSVSSLISSSDEDEAILPNFMNFDNDSQQKEPHNSDLNPSIEYNRNPPVVRSGSFVQRRKKKSSTSLGSPRKRSDPALTSKQISTISNAANSNPSSLSSARSSGTLMNSASIGAHDCTIKPLTGQRAKQMTASDSSLISTTSACRDHSNIYNDSNLFSADTPIKIENSSSRRTTRYRNTNDSAIQMDGSSEDDLNAIQTEKSDNSNETDQNVPVSFPIPPSPSSQAPPLPPRPDSQTEKRRQIQMEIMQTEEEHHEVLRYVRRIYQKPLKKEKFFTGEQIEIIFGNIKELRKIHRNISHRLNTANNKIHLQSMSVDAYHFEEAIFEIFCGRLGMELEQQASIFCVNRKIRNGIELWNQRKKDARLKGWVDSESRSRSMPDNPFARLGLDDLLSRVFQRPLRYPLLFERLLKATPKDSQGFKWLEQALNSCRKSGERINEATKKAELRFRLNEIIKKTDFSFNPSLVEISDHELLHDGPLVWRITKQKLIDVLLILTNQIILVLTRDSNDRYIVKTHSNPTTKHGHRPDIKMDDLLMRDVATDPTAFFLVSKNQDIIYEFAAPTSNERNKWKDVITSAIEQYTRNKDNKTEQFVNTTKTSLKSRSLTVGDFKNVPVDLETAPPPPPLPPPSILNRPLPKLPSNSSPPPIPAPLIPPSSSFVNRPLPKIPTESVVSNQINQEKYDGSIQYVSAKDCHPSTIEMVPFSQVRISHNPRVSLPNKPDDFKEINENLQNLIQERRRTGSVNYQATKFFLEKDLEREIREMSMVYDVAKHESDSKEILSHLVTDMFKKATEWSYKLVENDESAKQELSERVRNSVESFVKSFIDSNFILQLPGEGENSQIASSLCRTPVIEPIINQTNSITNSLNKSIHIANIDSVIKISDNHDQSELETTEVNEKINPDPEAQSCEDSGLKMIENALSEIIISQSAERIQAEVDLSENPQSSLPVISQKDKSENNLCSVAISSQSSELSPINSSELSENPGPSDSVPN
ncbi:rho guanine nucleotide exchange factor 12-like protein [Sarcoptes scabiei]|uniref:Rho guanine nucleotide exchange factor 12-like protein n=1 Tax=Sarcoptes scabiei TaxID=52283 RepID=A0A132A9M5_SARSC|nr:rho guanine nucleotide exchange factor 12-like protein [Sarcoptes scabiei]